MPSGASRARPVPGAAQAGRGRRRRRGARGPAAPPAAPHSRTFWRICPDVETLRMSFCGEPGSCSGSLSDDSSAAAPAAAGPARGCAVPAAAMLRRARRPLPPRAARCSRLTAPSGAGRPQRHGTAPHGPLAAGPARALPLPQGGRCRAPHEPAAWSLRQGRAPASSPARAEATGRRRRDCSQAQGASEAVWLHPFPSAG